MITLFDLPSQTPSGAWSPNTWKTRLCLNYKGIPYKTEWVEYTEIAALYHKHNLAGSPTKPDGSPGPFYSLPAILDTNQSAGGEIMIADSVKIAKYLDETYPNTPSVLPPDEASIKEQGEFAYKALLSMAPVFPSIFLARPQMGSADSHAKICNVRVGLLKKRFGPKYADITSLDEVKLSEEERRESVSKLGESLAALTASGGRIKTEVGGGDEVAWCFGEQITFADFAIAAGLIWARTVLGEDSLEWKEISELNGGKWKRFLDRLEPYQKVV